MHHGHDNSLLFHNENRIKKEHTHTTRHDKMRLLELHCKGVDQKTSVFGKIRNCGKNVGHRQRHRHREWLKEIVRKFCRPMINMVLM